MIYLIRHGLDDENYIGGYSDITLLEEGRKQVICAAEYLKNSNFKIEKIISSDIRRARETADIISDILKLKVEYDPLLRELDKGDLNGMLKSKANDLYPDYINVRDIFLKYPNGESMREFYERIKKDLDKILKMDNTLLVTHRGVINMLYYILKNISLDMDKEKFEVTHASIHQLNPKIKTIGKVEYKWER